MSLCATRMLPTDTSPRVDAQASETRTGIGGWLPVLDTRLVPDPWLSPWFSVEITPQVLPSGVLEGIQTLSDHLMLPPTPVSREGGGWVWGGSNPSPNPKLV